MEQLNGDDNVNNVDTEESHTVSRKHSLEKPNLKGNWLDFYLLILLYLIQGFSLGLKHGLSYILQSKKSITFEDQVSWYQIVCEISVL